MISSYLTSSAVVPALDEGTYNELIKDSARFAASGCGGTCSLRPEVTSPLQISHRLI